MKTIKQIIAHKGSEVAHIEPQANVVDAIKIMTEMNVGSMLVMDKGDIVGILTEKDFLQQIVLKDRLCEVVSVAEVMTTRVIAITSDQAIEQGLAIMTDKRVRHLPVMDNDELVGLVSIGDLVKAVIDEQQFTIEQLEHYVYC
jgi:CBS domain-containing protein